MKLTIGEVLKKLAEFAPLSLQETYDNTGLIIGDPETVVDRALIALDVTEAVLDEAVQKSCKLIIAHHPLIFAGIKKLTPTGEVERSVIKAIKNGIAVAAWHTNLDNITGGVNTRIAEKLMLNNTAILAPRTGLLKKIVTFCPETHAGQVRTALFEAGAGHIGSYDQCSYNTEGFGTFRAGEGTQPFVGTKGELHRESEIRIETVVPEYKLKAVINALLSKHPYEEVAYDVYPIENSFQAGAGIMGYLNEPMPVDGFLKHLKQIFGTPALRHTAIHKKMIHKVAACGGSGAFLIKNALSQQADAFVTADIKYHDYFESGNNMLLVDAGHFETEQFTKELIHDVILKKIPTFAPLISEVNTNPVHYFFTQ